MLTLDKYCERRLNGRSVKLLQKEIELLRTKLSQLESGSDELDSISAYFFRKGNKVNYKIYYLNRRLECAIKALVEAGGEYVPNIKELEAIEFNRKLDRVKYIIFYTDFCGEYTTEIMIVNDDKIEVAVRGTGFGIGDGYTYELQINKTELIEKLKYLHMNEWRKKYSAPILDGTSWKIIIVSAFYKEIARFEGSNEWPYNYSEFTKIFSKF